MNPFQVVDNLTVNKKEWKHLTDEEKNAFIPFLTHRTLSMNPDLTELVNFTQRHHNIPPAQVYKLYLRMLPKKLDRYKYIKKTPMKENKELLQILAEHYQSSQQEAKDILYRIGRTASEQILHGLGYTTKEIQKLFKHEHESKTKRTGRTY